MDKIWIVLLFLGVFLLGSSVVKRLMIRFINTADRQDAVFAIVAEKEDPKVFWNESGNRREPENAKYTLLEEDFFENEVMEFSETFEEELSSLSDEEIDEVLKTAEIFKEEESI